MGGLVEGRGGLVLEGEWRVDCIVARYKGAGWRVRECR
jgi:hypothetical protein